MREKTRPKSIAELMDLAVSHHRAGRLHEAAAHYEQILQLEPEHAHALNLSGLVALRTGHTELAIALISRAASKEPGAASYFFNLGLVFDALVPSAGRVAHISLVFREMWDSIDVDRSVRGMNRESKGKSSGIPYLAKNERDMGHPSLVREQEPTPGNRARRRFGVLHLPARLRK